MKKHINIYIAILLLTSCTTENNYLSVAPDILTRGNDVPSTYVVNLSDYGIKLPLEFQNMGTSLPWDSVTNLQTFILSIYQPTLLNLGYPWEKVKTKRTR